MPAARRTEVGSVPGLEELAREQASLRRVATLVAEAAPAETLFAAVAEELGSVIPDADVALVGRYESGAALEVVGGWSRTGDPSFVGQRVVLGGHNVSTLVFERRDPVRLDHLGDDSAPATALAREWARSAAGAPINVEGRLWGVMIVGSLRLDSLPRGIEDRLADFSELIATAISNATARSGMAALADEQAALRRVATLVARGAPPGEIFGAVAVEVGGLLGPDHAVMARFDAHDVVTIVAEWRSTGEPPRLERLRALSGGSIAKLIQDTGKPVRIDDYARAARGRQSWVLDSGTRAAVAAPIMVDGRLWGVMGVGSRGAPPPAGTEERLADFTELVATAIANAQAREELQAIAAEQAALRRVATLVAESAPGPVVFAAVAEEVGGFLRAERTFLARFDADNVVEVVGTWVGGGEHAMAEGSAGQLDEAGLSRLVRDTNRPARVDFSDASWAALPSVRRLGLRSAVGAPISVQGRIWGMIEVASTSDEPVAPGTEDRLAGFTELVATAIANSQARGELSTLAEEQAALRRVATLVSEGAPPDTVFAAVTAEGSRLFDAPCALLRYDPDGIATIVGRAAIPDAPAIGTQVPLGGHNAATLVFETGRPARVDAFGADPNPLSVLGRAVGRSAVGAPIHVAGRLWGVVALNSQRDEPFAQGTEGRLEGFAELVANAIANADARAELTASRARVLATADETRRRIERDLHDGAQQRLVAVGLQLRAAQAAVPSDLGDLAADLDRVGAGLTLALDELREFARGIHPTVLRKGGLAPALRALARRSTVPVELDVQVSDRMPEPIELGAYYVVSEALTNAVKHADATRVDIAVEQTDDVLRLVVRDDGAGGARFVPGSGLVGLNDRVEALGGRLSVESQPGAGTTLQVEIPIAASPAT